MDHCTSPRRPRPTSGTIPVMLMATSNSFRSTRFKWMVRCCFNYKIHLFLFITKSTAVGAWPFVTSLSRPFPFSCLLLQISAFKHLCYSCFHVGTNSDTMCMCKDGICYPFTKIETLKSRSNSAQSRSLIVLSYGHRMHTTAIGLEQQLALVFLLKSILIWLTNMNPTCL